MKLYLGAFIIFFCMAFCFATSGNAEQKFHTLKNYSVTYELSGNTTGTKEIPPEQNNTLLKTTAESNAGLRNPR